MASEPGQTRKDTDAFALDERVLEELKEKAVAAKERAYCRCWFFYLPSRLHFFSMLLLSLLFLNGKSLVRFKTIHKNLQLGWEV